MTRGNETWEPRDEWLPESGREEIVWSDNSGFLLSVGFLLWLLRGKSFA